MPEEQKVFPVDPTPLILSDGKPRELRYTNGSFKRLKKALGVKTMREVFEMEFSEVVAQMIHVGLVEKDISPDEIDELIPAAHIGEVQAVVFAAIAGSSPEEIKNAMRAAQQNLLAAPATMTM
jgi:hypothetical protein